MHISTWPVLYDNPRREVVTRSFWTGDILNIIIICKNQWLWYAMGRYVINPRKYQEAREVEGEVTEKAENHMCFGKTWSCQIPRSRRFCATCLSERFDGFSSVSTWILIFIITICRNPIHSRVWRITMKPDKYLSKKSPTKQKHTFCPTGGLLFYNYFRLRI